ncbi:MULTISPECIES: radical SAM protein [unclassified Helicobacter]|uniref:radical SAM protein n=1 Tax=unclassified Helicobacter TaxID=2593540 RepID=UPI00131511F7|nr:MULTISPECIES: radical SAM protein [unclassified Helicobacter]
MLGFVDIPKIEVILTTKCTLRCESCSNLMQYFSSNQQFTTNIDNIKSNVDKLLQNIDSISLFTVLGGEPLLFKELPELMGYLSKQSKIKFIELITNATIPFGDKLLVALRSPKIRVAISDYSSNPALKSILKQQAIMKSLVNFDINHIVLKSADVWREIGGIYKRNRPTEEIRRNYLACKMPCVSLLCQDKEKDSEAIISICPIASALVKLKGAKEFEGDFVRAYSPNFKNDILRFYAQDFYKACDYCPNKWEEAKPISPAVQTKKTLELMPPESTFL